MTDKRYWLPSKWPCRKRYGKYNGSGMLLKAKKCSSIWCHLWHMHRLLITWYWISYDVEEKSTSVQWIASQNTILKRFPRTRKDLKLQTLSHSLNDRFSGEPEFKRSWESCTYRVALLKYIFPSALSLYELITQKVKSAACKAKVVAHRNRIWDQLTADNDQGVLYCKDKEPNGSRVTRLVGLYNVKDMGSVRP